MPRSRPAAEAPAGHRHRAAATARPSRVGIISFVRVNIGTLFPEHNRGRVCGKKTATMGRSHPRARRRRDFTKDRTFPKRQGAPRAATWQRAPELGERRVSAETHRARDPFCFRMIFKAASTFWDRAPGDPPWPRRNRPALRRCFRPRQREAMRQKVETALKGAPFARLISKTYDGSTSRRSPRLRNPAPSAAPATGRQPPRRSSRRRASNALALADLETAPAACMWCLRARRASLRPARRRATRPGAGACGSTRACASCSTCPAMPTPSSPPSKPWSPPATGSQNPRSLARPRSARRGGPFRRALDSRRPASRSPRKPQGAERKGFVCKLLWPNPPDISIVVRVRLQGGCRIAPTGK